MKLPFKIRVLPAVLAGVLAAPFAWADDEVSDTDTGDREVVETVADVPSSKIAGFFSDFFGDEALSQQTVEGLRDGSISYQPPEDIPEDGGAEGDTGGDTAGDAPADDIEDVEGEDGEATVGMGYGNVLITLALAEQLAMSSAAEALEGETGMTADESLNEILYLRQVEGMGWGGIAKELGVNLGEVISGIRSNRPERMEARADKRAARTEKSMRGKRPEKAEMASVERGPRAEKVERVEKAERPVRPERPAKPERPEKPARPERPSR